MEWGHGAFSIPMPALILKVEVVVLRPLTGHHCSSIISPLLLLVLVTLLL
jgi:hypothetical protein